MVYHTRVSPRVSATGRTGGTEQGAGVQGEQAAPAHQGENILSRMMMRRKAAQGKGSTPVGKVKVKKMKQEPENVTGWQEMKKLMEQWSRKKRKREEDGTGAEQAADEAGRDTAPGTRDEQGRGVGSGGAGTAGIVTAPGTRDEQGLTTADIDIEVTVTNNVDSIDNRETLVARTRRKFITRSASPTMNTDFDTWKKEREELRRMRELPALPGHGQVAEQVHGGGGGTAKKKRRLYSGPETGAISKSNSINNYNCYSLLGGREAGVQRQEGAGGGNDGGEVQPASTDSGQQYTRREGTFFISAGRQNCTAASSGENQF